MPRYIVERSFSDRFPIAAGPAGADRCRTVVDRNSDEAVTWLHSYVSDDGRKTFCVFRHAHTGGDPQDGRVERLPVDRITQVSVLDPYSYTHWRSS